MVEQTEVVVVGGGQAGLSIGRLLSDQGRDYLLLERSPSLGNAWRNDRWDSFTLVTPNWTLRLPGFHYCGDAPDGFLPRAEIVRYLEDYAASFSPPVRFNTAVTAVHPGETAGQFVIESTEGTIQARSVVIATGLFQQPKQPIARSSLPPGVESLHSGEYRNPDALPPGAVLVVGTAQSGCQIAEELYQSGRQVFLCVGGAGRLPRRYRGRDIIWWLENLGFFAETYESAPPPKSRFAGNPHLSGKDGGRTLNLHQFARDGVHLLGRLRDIRDGRLYPGPDLHENLAKADDAATKVVRRIDELITQTGAAAPPSDVEPPLRDGFATREILELDVRRAGITSIVWGAGYAFDFSWVRFPVLDMDGFPVQRQGVTAVPGLFFLGLHWLHTRKSGLFLGVGDDAAHIASAIATHFEGGPHAPQ